jgi:transposase
MRKAYQTDLSDAEWFFLEPLLPLPNATGPPKMHSTREILNAVFYIVRGGCAWRLLPHDLEHPGRLSTTTSAPGAWTGRGRRCMPPCVSECEFA